MLYTSREMWQSLKDEDIENMPNGTSSRKRYNSKHVGPTNHKTVNKFKDVFLTAKDAKRYLTDNEITNMDAYPCYWTDTYEAGPNGPLHFHVGRRRQNGQASSNVPKRSS